MRWILSPFLGGPDRIALSVILVILISVAHYYKVFLLLEPMFIKIGLDAVPTFSTNPIGAIVMSVATYLVVFVGVRMLNR